MQLFSLFPLEITAPLSPTALEKVLPLIPNITLPNSELWPLRSKSLVRSGTPGSPTGPAQSPEFACRSSVRSGRRISL